MAGAAELRWNFTLNNLHSRRGIMNKKLLFAAVGAALSAAPMAVVHADTTLYGHFHEAFENINNGNSKNGFTTSNSTRFGIKGGEDLGGGLKAIYQVESGAFSATDGTNGFGGTLRNTYLGFAGDWGAVKVGRYDTPFKDLGRAFDNFNEQVGDMRNLLSGGSFPSSSALYNYVDARVSNMIRYESPTFSGFNVNFLHSSSNGTQGPGGTGNSVNSLGANWTGGGFIAGLAYQKDGFQNNQVLAVNDFGVTNVTATKTHDSFWRGAGGYKMDDLFVGLLYQQLNDIGGLDLKQKAYGVAASYKMANNLIKFHYLKAKDFTGTVTGINNFDGSGGKLWALGVDHMFSKSTLVYVDYAQASNDNNTRAYSVVSGNAGNGVDDLPPAGKLGQKVKGITAGMVLNF
jgi:predicted porin